MQGNGGTEKKFEGQRVCEVSLWKWVERVTEGLKVGSEIERGGKERNIRKEERGRRREMEWMRERERKEREGEKKNGKVREKQLDG